MNWLVWTGLGIGLLVAVGAGLVAFGHERWAGSTPGTAGAARSRPGASDCWTLRRTRDRRPARASAALLPRGALKDGQSLIGAATFELAGTINMSATGENWKPFTSWQRAVVHRPGFLWNGRVVMFPGVAANVHDSYIAGVGTLHAAMLGLFTVAEVQGGGEIARGELMRYFAEMVWYPTALLPSQGVS